MSSYPRRVPILLCFFLILITACGSAMPTSLIAQQAAGEGQVSDSTSGDVDVARRTLILFFEALWRGDYQTAAQVYWSPNPLQLIYKDVEPEDGEALLEKACESAVHAGCRFYCWRIKDVVGQSKVSSHSFVFTVRFEDPEGNLLSGGDNVTPGVCAPPDCPRTQFAYTVRKEGEAFYVEGVPVFSGCWP